MGKAEENKLRKRNSLLAQAYELFVNKGIHATTIAEIAGQAGVAKGTFYFYFRDKQDLIDHIIARKSEGILLHALEALREKETRPAHPGDAASAPLPVEEKLIILVDDIIGRLEKDPKLVRFLDRNLDSAFIIRLMHHGSLMTSIDLVEEYKNILRTGTDRWKDEWLMLYTVIELVSGLIHPIIVSGQPCSLETYLPYLHDCIRAIVDCFRVK